jgi:signal transduction histidine kinase
MKPRIILIPLKLILLSLLLFAGQLAAAADLVTARAYVDDASSQMTLSDVQRQPAVEFSGVLSRGFTKSATWIRVTIAGIPDALPGDTLAVRIRPTYLDQIRLYDPLDDSGRIRQTGDYYDWRQSEFKSLNHGFVIPASRDTRQIWLRLSTTSSSFIHVEVLTPDDAQQANRLQETLYGLMMGLLLLFFLWAASHWLMSRENLMAMFTASQLMAIVYALSTVGYNRLLLTGLLPVRTIEVIANLIFCSYVFIGFIFHYRFLREFRPVRGLLWLLAGLAVTAFCAEIVLISLDRVRAAMQTNVSVVSFSSLLVLGIAISTRAWTTSSDDERPPIPKWTLVGFYLVVSSVLVMATAHGLGLLNGPEFALHMYLIHGMMTGSVLIALLQLRALRIEQARNLATLHARSAAQQVEMEKQKSQLQSRFMEMLAHELKTSLAVLHMVFGAAKTSPEMLEHGRRTVKSINDLIERCLQAERFEDNEIISHYEDFRIDALLDDAVSKTQDAQRFVVQQEESITVNSDWQIFKTVVSNLLDNALKYSSAGSMINVRVVSAVHEGVRGCEISVDNDVPEGAGSPGFPDQAELFKKYYRADGARKHSGSGLGLYLVANFMRLLGGSVRYDKLDNRVRFAVWLPN